MRPLPELRLLERAGHIRDLQRQVVFVLAPPVKFKGARRTTPALRYVADFGYTDTQTGERITEDVKGVLTAVYKIKRHLVAHLYGITIRETR